MQTDIGLLAEMIKEKLGIDMTYNTDGLLRKMNKRLEELNKSVWEYINYLKTNPLEWEHVIDIVTINETYFFREREQLELFKNLLEKTTKKTIRIWCAACSTGEEPYSLAILAKEALGSDVKIEIVASDINRDVIEFAKKGEYSKSSLSFRRLQASTIQCYFDEYEDVYKIKPEYKELVSFTPFNLVDPDRWILMKNFDIIFCRNVLIYFDEETTKTIIENFYHSLNEQGALFLGHSDPYRQIYKDFQLIRTTETIYLMKGDEL